MNSLILLQAGSAMGGGFAITVPPDMGVRLIIYIAFSAVFVPALYFAVKQLWPKDKW